MDFKASSASLDLTTLLGHPTSGFEIRPQAHERSFFKIEMSAYLVIGRIWTSTIPRAYFYIIRLIHVGVRVANELGAGNGKGAKFATIVSVSYSLMIGVFFCAIILAFHDKLAYIFTSSSAVVEAVDKMSYLLGVAILLNSVQPVLSGVAVGSGWQSTVAYINFGCYYISGLPLGVLIGFVFNMGLMGIWSGMIFGGTAIQTLILAVITIRTDWEKQAEQAKTRVIKWSDPQRDDQPEVQH